MCRVPGVIHPPKACGRSKPVRTRACGWIVARCSSLSARGGQVRCQLRRQSDAITPQTVPNQALAADVLNVHASAHDPREASAPSDINRPLAVDVSYLCTLSPKLCPRKVHLFAHVADDSVDTAQARRDVGVGLQPKCSPRSLMRDDTRHAHVSARFRSSDAHICLALRTRTP